MSTGLPNRRMISSMLAVAALALMIVLGLVTPWWTFDLPEHRAGCAQNLRALSLAFETYADDWDDRLPHVGGWPNAISPYMKFGDQCYHCPGDPAQRWPAQRWPDYACNPFLAGMKMHDITNPTGVIVFFDSNAGTPSPADTGQSLPNPPRHGRNNLCFLDGHVAALVAPPAGAWAPRLVGAGHPLPRP